MNEAQQRQALLELAWKLEATVARAFREAILEVQSAAQLNLIQAAIDDGRWDEVAVILQMRPELFAPLDDSIRQAFLQGGAFFLASVPKKTRDPRGARLVIRFEGQNPRAQQRVLQFGAELVTNVIEGQREAIRETISEQVGQKHSRSIALDIVGRPNSTGRLEGGILGLTSRDAATIRRYRKALTDGDIDRMRDYLSRKSRDRRFDEAVKRAIAEGRGLKPTEVEKRIARMSDRMLRRRGENIAQSETIPALNAGRREAVAQMIDRGVISAQDVKRIWDDTNDGRQRPMHRAMDGQEVEWDRPFTGPDGSLLMGPGDTSLGAEGEMTINCRCFERIRIDYVAAARRAS